MNDLKKFTHGQEGTHGCCQEISEKMGGKAECCACTGHHCTQQECKCHWEKLEGEGNHVSIWPCGCKWEDGQQKEWCSHCTQQESSDWEKRFDDKKFFVKLFYEEDGQAGFDWYLNQDKCAEDVKDEIKKFIATELQKQRAQTLAEERNDLWVDIHDEVSDRWYCVDFSKKGKEGVQMFEAVNWHFHKPHKRLAEMRNK